MNQSLDRATSALVDSAPGHQETLKPPSGGFFIAPFYQLSFKRTHQLPVPMPVDVV